ncbi:MAG: hypothetical protein A3C55_05385 [Gammaproteobacteria bacterium RIFCSPHIGHO2_02_FULL_42_13]|nr:MAG: hypothetical protein A3C55_05385 [Gammaproteobacteria bacterium RIFCSPHIGHO2_02_FULL_42_13]OGT68500.1 MAG: hypothetical protein A3H43_05875 [Gammaproteobacteria bacterium RIFCSPLOWO2_02_FULL_42_9]
MSTWAQILWALIAVFLIWFLYRGVKASPDSFSRKNLSRSIFTFGVLALILIGFIALLVVLLKY